MIAGNVEALGDGVASFDCWDGHNLLLALLVLQRQVATQAVIGQALQ